MNTELWWVGNVSDPMKNSKFNDFDYQQCYQMANEATALQWISKWPATGDGSL